jgi:hypothetical protein
MKDLFQEEEKVLSRYLKKIDDNEMFIDDVESFGSNYRDLIDQSKVITRISDRLQKKLDLANQKIKSQNTEIQAKNEQLENTIVDLASAKVGKKASRVLFVLAIVLFISEELFIEPLLGELSFPYVGLVIKAFIAFGLKIFESSLEGYYMQQEQKDILKNKGKSLKSKLEYTSR